MSNDSLRRLSEVALIGICSVWGLTFVMVQDAIEELPSMAFLAYRFIPAGLIVAPPRLGPEQSITVCLQQEVVVGYGHVPPVPDQMDKPESRKNRRVEGNHPHVPRVLPPPLAFSLIRPSMATDGAEKRRSRRRNGLIIEIWKRKEHLEPLVEERPHRQGVLGPLVDAAPHPPPDRPSERRDNPSAAPAECPDHERSVTR